VDRAGLLDFLGIKGGQPGSPRETVAALRATLAGQDQAGRLRALAALTNFLPFGLRETESVSEALDAVLEALRYDPDAPVRREALQVLRRHGPVRPPPLLLDALFDALNDNDDEVRRGVREILARSDLSGSVPRLLQALSAHHSDVRKFAVCCLAKLRNPSPEVLNALRDALVDQARNVRRAARRQARQATLTVLLERLEDADERARAWAAHRLGVMGRRTCNSEPDLAALLVPSLAARLADPAAGVRIAAAQALGALGPAARGAAAALLAAWLADTDPRIKKAVTAALASLGAALPANTASEQPSRGSDSPTG
jgi:HEAT repeat protein